MQPPFSPAEASIAHLFRCSQFINVRVCAPHDAPDPASIKM